MITLSSIASVLSFFWLFSSTCHAFSPASTAFTTTTTTRTTTTTGVALHALPALVKKAKLAEIQRTEFTEEEMKLYHSLTSNDDTTTVSSTSSLQQALTKRRGTITIIPEFRRSFTIDRVTTSILDPPLFSSRVRDAGATAVAVLVSMNSSQNNNDLATILEEQRRAQFNVPGTLPVICNDVILDIRQIAKLSLAGVSAVVFDTQYFANDDNNNNNLKSLVQACSACGMESIVTVRKQEDVEKALACGATLLKIEGDDIDVEMIPEEICKIGTIAVRNDQHLAEIEQAWALRDAGYHAVWVSEVLYKKGEQPAAIIKAMKSKSSLKWASPTARSGRGEGAKEYLGDIMM